MTLPGCFLTLHSELCVPPPSVPWERQCPVPIICGIPFCHSLFSLGPEKGIRFILVTKWRAIFRKQKETW